MTLTRIHPATLTDAGALDPIFRVMASLGEMHGLTVTSPAPGYFIGGLNTHKLAANVTVDEYPEMGDLSSYGVADSPEQFIERFGATLQADPRTFAVFFAPIVKSDQPPEGGWRWHKWGEYIGDKNPQHEYIYDEDDSIERVYIFHIVATDY